MRYKHRQNNCLTTIHNLDCNKAANTCRKQFLFKLGSLQMKFRDHCNKVVLIVIGNYQGIKLNERK